MVTESAACAPASGNPSVKPAAKTKMRFIRKLQSLDLAESGPIRRMPKSDRAFGQRDKSVEAHSCKCSERDFRPDHVDGHASCLGRYPEPDALRWCSEKLCNDRADQGEGRVDLQRVENEWHRCRQIQLAQALRVVRGIGTHQVALDVAGCRQ